MIDELALHEALISMIKAIGDDPDREGLSDTPRRVTEMYSEFFAGLDQNPHDALKTGFEEGHHEMVVIRDVPFFSICEHHFLPFQGTADIGYIPNGRVAGASKLARALDILARRPQLQERLTSQLADSISESLDAVGVGVVIEAEHLCMSLRGVKKPGSRIVTSAMRGTLQDKHEVRQQFDSLRWRDS